MTATWVSFTSEPDSEAIATSTRPNTGTPAPSAHAASARVTMLAVTGRSGGRCDSARATTGRSSRSLIR